MRTDQTPLRGTCTMRQQLLVKHHQAADLLGVSPKTLLNLRKSGGISFVRVSDSPKGIRYSVRELECWIAQRQQLEAKE